MTQSTPPFDFDTPLGGNPPDAMLWRSYAEDVLPLRLAEMAFRSPPAVVDALKERADYGIFGYAQAPDELREAIVQRMADLYAWPIKAEWIVFNPGMNLTLNLVVQTALQAGEAALIPTPSHGPFNQIPAFRGRFAQMMDLQYVADDDHSFHYEMDVDALEQVINAQTRLFYLCDPHNPGGRLWTEAEQSRIADLCLRHELWLCADAIHCDLILDEQAHYRPIAALDPAIEQRSITLIATTKAYNLSGLACAMAIVPDATLRQQMHYAMLRSGYHVDGMAYVATQAAYQYGDDWMQALRSYLRANRDYLLQFIRAELPMLKTTVPQATYLAWLDCSALTLGVAAPQFFLEQARVALRRGDEFGPRHGDFVRLSFAFPRSMLQDALRRMKAAVDAR